MKKRMLSLLMACVLLCAMLPLSTSAEASRTDTTIGEKPGDVGASGGLEPEVVAYDGIPAAEMTGETVYTGLGDLLAEIAEGETPVSWPRLEPPGDVAALLGTEPLDDYESVKQVMMERLCAFYAGEIEDCNITARAASREDAEALFRQAFIRMPLNYPEKFYYFESYLSYTLSSVEDGVWTIQFTPVGENTDLMTDSVTFEMAVDQACLECFGSPDGKNERMTDLEKIVAAHDWLSACCCYDPSVSYGLSRGSASWTAPDGVVHTYAGKHGAYPALVWRKAECGGFARAFKVLMDRAGVNCSVVTGKNPVSGSTHVWNIVELDGTWYHVDCTFDSQTWDGVYDYAGRISRNWLLVSDLARASSGYEWSAENGEVCPVTYELHAALKTAGTAPALYHNGSIWLADSAGTLFQYEAGTDFASSVEAGSLGFIPSAGVCDHRTGTLYYTQESGGSVSIWSFTPGEGAAATKLAEVGDFTRCGLYADAMPSGQTLLRAVYGYSTVERWTLGEPATSHSPATFAGGSGTADDPYILSTAEQLREFAARVNDCDTDYNAACFALASDIDLGGVDSNGSGIAENMWAPVGKSADGQLTAFKGIFDGQGYSICGMYVRGGNCAGLFSCIYGGEIKNLNVSGIVEGGSYLGGVCGCSAGTISNCSSAVRITADGNYIGGIAGLSYQHPITNCSSACEISAEGNRIGGIVGYNSNSKWGIPHNNWEYVPVNGNLTDCRNSGTVASGGQYAGGIAGYDSEGDITGCENFGGTEGGTNYAGGIVGYCDSAVLSDCGNAGEVVCGIPTSNASTSFIGGVAGYSRASSVSNCHNTGKVAGRAPQSYNVGGVVGFSSSSQVSDCYNRGPVSSKANVVGGVAAHCTDGGTIERCYNTGSVSGGNIVGGVLAYCNEGSEVPAFVRDCYNTGAVTGISSWIGGVIGWITSGLTVENCYSIGTVSGLTLTGGIVGCMDVSSKVKNASGTVRGCYYLKSDNVNGGLDAIGKLNGGAIDGVSGPLSASQFADWSSFSGWNSEIWAVRSGLVLSADSVSVRPVLVGNGEISAVSDTVFQINGISVRDSGGRTCGAVPKGDLFATVSVTNLISGISPTVLLTAYDSTGRFTGLMYFSVESTEQSTMHVTIPVRNPDGSIVRLKAFAVVSFSDLTPLSDSTVFPG